MSRIYQTLKIHSGEERMSMLLVGLMLVTAAGAALGGNAIEALFFDRFGVEQLPAMYILLGLLTFAATMAITVLMGRVARRRLYAVLPIVLGLVLIGEWLVIPLNIRWFFAAMWLGMNVINSLQGLLVWGLAGAACDTRQAKRLFPLFSAGFILGTVIGGLITPPLATRLHAENLLLLWAVAVFASFFFGRALAGHIVPIPNTSREQKTSFMDEMQRGYKFVRRSPIMQWVSYSAILFSVCFFSLALPFSRGVAAQFPDTDKLTGFLGLFQSLNTGAALLLSLLIANRLFARFGIMPMLLVFPIVYLIGFGALTFAAPFSLLVAIRFAQMSYMSGVADTSWQALFNVVPPEQRDQVRAFVGGVPAQAGTIIAGLVLVVGEQALQPQNLYLIGFAAAALLVYFIWRARIDYSRALVDALRAGQPQMFFSEEQPFGGLHTDAAAVSIAIQGLRDSDPSVRRVSAEIVGHLPTPEAATALVDALTDDDSAVKVAALKGLTGFHASSALLEIATCLSDPEPEVRLTAIDSLGQLASSPRGVVAQVEPLLADDDPLVSIQAAQTLLLVSKHTGARDTLQQMANHSEALVRASALDTLGKCGDESAFALALTALDDVQPMVRKAAASVLVDLNPLEALNPLIRHLDDSSKPVREMLARSISRIGEPALGVLVNTLSDPSREDGALLALSSMPVQKLAAKIRAYARFTSQTALRYHALALGMAQRYGLVFSGDGRIQLLIESLRGSSLHCGLNTLYALGLVIADKTVAVAAENLGSRDIAQRANALEMLESVGEREIIRPLLALWESGETASPLLPEGWLSDLMDDPHTWLRACAVLVAAESGNDSLQEKIFTMSQSDPDEFVCAVAHAVTEIAPLGEKAMDTLATLSLMERILFLRRVPLFANLPPVDLKQVATIAGEVLFSDGQVICKQGDMGTGMYIVVSGEVLVQMTSEGQKEPYEVARRRTGDYVGEVSIIIQEPRMATLIALGAVRALHINQKQFEGILRERPETSLSMMRVLCQRLKEASERVVI
jgi:HEAT repeat protein/ATP/ADP translocase